MFYSWSILKNAWVQKISQHEWRGDLRAQKPAWDSDHLFYSINLSKKLDGVTFLAVLAYHLPAGFEGYL